MLYSTLLHVETIPDECCSSTLVPIFKTKADVQECRGIKLVSHTMKVLQKVIERRRTIREESEITQNQGLSVSRLGTTDASFARFVDLDKAYNRVTRDVLWRALKDKERVKNMSFLCNV